MNKKKINTKRIFLITIAVVLLVLSITKLFFANKASAAWFDDTYAYRKAFSFTHNAALTNRRVTITVDTATLITAGKMQSTCADTRFTDIDGLTLDYQLTGTCNNAATTYDVLFPTIINGTNNGYIYYGNTSALSQSKDISTFTLLSPSGGAPAFASEEKGDPPSVYWGLDEGSGQTINDGSSNANSGTLGANSSSASDDPTWTTGECISGNCLKFDGTNDIVTASKISKNVQTISFWVRPNTIATQGLINLDGGTHKVSTDASGVISATGWSSPTYYINGVTSATPTLVLNQWNHVEITTASGFDSTSSFTIGTDGTNFIKGFIDEFKIYNYARSAAQVKADFIKAGAKKGSSVVLGTSDQSYLSNGLVGYWKMDESSWTVDCSTASVIDSSGNGNNGAACPNSTGPAGGASGKFGNAGSFDGSNDYLAKSSPSNLPTGSNTVRSMGFWFNVASAPASTTAYAGYGNASAAKNFQIGIDVGAGNTNKWAVFGFGNGNDWDTTIAKTSYNDGTWHHVFVTYDGKTTRIFFDGVQKDSTTSFVWNTTASEMTVASQVVSHGEYMNGKLDDFRIYNRALSADEVKALYNWAPGPVGYWKMDEGSWTNDCSTSTVFDSSGNGNNGTSCPNSTGPTGNAIGKFGNAGSFDGSNDYVNIAASSNLAITSFTIETWVYVPTSIAAGWQDIVYHEDSGFTSTNAYGLFKSGNGSGNTFHFRWNSGSGAQDFTSTFSANNWYYVVGTFDAASGVVNMYQNGVLDSTVTGATAGTAHSDVVSIGRKPDNSEFFTGKLDDVKIYNYARTSTQIIEDMNAGHPVGGSPLGSQLIYWSLDEQNGNTINNSGNGGTTYNGTNSGAAWLTNTTCKTNGCLNFDTTTDNVSAGDLAFLDSLTGFSTSFWLNPQTLATNKMILSKANNTTQRVFQIKTDDTTAAKLKVMISSSASDVSNYCVTSASVLTASTWQHVVVSYDGTQATGDDSRVKVYINGVLKSCTVTGTIPTSFTSGTTSNFKLGQGDDSTPTALIGYVDELKVYQFPLTIDQVKIDMNAGASENFGVTSSTEATLLTSGAGNYPVGWWKFDEKSGTTANDISGNSNTGTLTHGPTWGSSSVCKIGACILFDGSDDVVDAGSGSTLDDLSSMTLEAWIYPKSLGGGSLARIMEKAATVTTQGWRFQLNSSNSIIFAQDYDGVADLSRTSANSVFSLNAWSHITVTWTGSSTATNIHIYVNGVETGYGTTTNGVGNRVSDAAQTLKIGNTTDGTRGFDGYIDNPIVYNYVRSQSQISYDYNRGLPIALWQFDECQGTTANDVSGFGNNGTINIGATGTYTSAGACGSGTSTHAWNAGTNGKFNGSLAFDGTDDYVACTDAACGSTSKLDFGASVPFTFSAWLKTTSSGAAVIIGKKSSTAAATAGYIAQLSSSNFGVCRVSDGTNQVSPTGTRALNDGNWHLITCVTDGSSLKLYTDGILESTSSTTTVTGSLDNTSDFRVAETGGAGTLFTGQIDDVRIYNYALSQSQINEIINQGAGVRYGPASGTPAP